MARSEAFFYHYTNGPALREILKTHKLLASTDTQNDAKCGEGVYVTEKTPDHHTDEQLLFNNFDNGFPGKTTKDTQYYIKFSRSSLGKRKIVDGAKDGRNRYVIVGGDLELKNMKFSVGKRKDGDIIREVMVVKTPEVLSWLEDDLTQGPTYSCLSCHQSIDPNQFAIRLRDQTSGVHEKCWNRSYIDMRGLRCFLCQKMVDGFGLRFSDDSACHLPCISSASDPECSTLTCKYCNTPAPVRIDGSVLFAGCRRAECRKQLDMESLWLGKFLDQQRIREEMRQVHLANTQK